MKSPVFGIPCSCVLLMLAVCARPAFGSSFTMNDLNSQAVVTPTSQAGMQSWTVDGVDQLAQQWFWYGVGSGSASSLDALGTPVVTQANSASLTLAYTGSIGLAATVTYTLGGGAPGSNTSEINESITLQNTTTSSMPLHFYQYSNFQLGGGSVGNYLQFSNNVTVDQTATVGNMMMSLSETAESADTPPPNEWQGGAYPSLLNLLNGGGPVTLNDMPAIGAPPIGPGDMSWAYEWDKTLSAASPGVPGGELIISKLKNISATPTPEPGTLVLVAGGGIVLLGCVRRRRRRATS